MKLLMNMFLPFLHGTGRINKHCIARRFLGLQFWGFYSFLLNLKIYAEFFVTSQNWGMVYSLLSQFGNHL